jgi:hypothetical protein
MESELVTAEVFPFLSTELQGAVGPRTARVLQGTGNELTLVGGVDILS